MFKEKLQYFVLCLFIYLMLDIVDALIFSMFIDLISMMIYVRCLIYGCLYLLINPFITKIIIDKFIFF